MSYRLYLYFYTLNILFNILSGFVVPDDPGNKLNIWIAGTGCSTACL